MRLRLPPGSFLVACLVFVLVSPALARAVPKSWSNPSGGPWSEDANWSPFGVPGPGDDVTIDLDGTYTVDVDTAVTVASLTLGGAMGTQTLFLMNQALDLAGPSLVDDNGVLLFSGGSLVVSDALEVQGKLDWTSGVLSGAGTTTITGDLEVRTASGKAVDPPQVLEIAGLATWSGGSFGLDGAARLKVLAGGTFAIDTDGLMNDQCCAGVPLVENFGTIVKLPTSMGTTELRVPVDNFGTIRAEQGILQLTRGGIGTGTYDTDGGNIELDAGTFDLADVTFTAFNNEVRITGATVLFTGEASVERLWLAGGTLAGLGSLTVTDLFRWSGGVQQEGGLTRILPGARLELVSSAPKQMRLDRVIEVEGEAVLNESGPLTGTGPGTLLEVKPGGTFTIDGGADLDTSCCDGPPLFRNGGTFIQASPTPSVVDVIFENLGTTRVESSELSFIRESSGTGGFEALFGASLVYDAGMHVVDAGTTFTGDGDVRLDGATLTFTADTEVPRLDFRSGTLGGVSEVTISDRLDWSGGTMRDAGFTRVPASATLAIGGTSPKFLDLGRQLVHEGTGTVEGTGKLFMDDGAVLENAPGATLTLVENTDVDTPCCGPDGLVLNRGLLVKSGTVGGTTIVDVPFDNEGQVRIDEGTIRLTRGATTSGTWNVAAGRSLENGAGVHSLGAGASFPGAGDVAVTGGTLAVDAPVVLPRLTVSGGILMGAAALDVTERLDWTGGTLRGAATTRVPPGSTLAIDGAGVKTLDGGHRLEIGGSGTWSGSGSILADDGVTRVIVLPGATFSLESDATLQDACCVGTPRLRVEGTLVKTADASGTSTIDVPFDNEGEVRVDSGTLRLSGGGTSSGDFLIAAGSTLAWDGGDHVLADATLQGAGEAAITGTALTLEGLVMARRFRQAAGLLDGEGVLSVSESFVWTGGTMAEPGTTLIESTATLEISGAGSKTLDLDRRLEIAGTATLTSSQLFADEALTEIRVLPGGVLDLATDGSLTDSCCGGRPRIVNEGLLVKSVGAAGGDYAIGARLEGPGQVEVQQGRLELAGGGATSGPFTIADGAELALVAGTHSLLAGSVVDGPGTLSLEAGATLAVDGALSAGKLAVSGGFREGPGLLEVRERFDWTGGTLRGSGVTRVIDGALLGLSGATKLLEQGHRLEIDGTATWTGGNLTLDDPGTLLDVLPGASLEIATGADLLDGCCGGQPAARNAGTIVKTAGSDTTTVTMPFNTSGEVRIETGTLSFSQGYVQEAGTTEILAGATLAATGGAPVDLQGGVLRGSGTVEGDLFNAAEVAPGASPGTLSVTGRYTQAPEGLLAIELAGPGPGELDAVDVGEDLVLDGTLSVTLIEPFFPEAGDTFSFVSGSPVAGDFATLVLPVPGLFELVETASGLDLVAQGLPPLVTLVQLASDTTDGGALEARVVAESEIEVVAAVEFFVDVADGPPDFDDVFAAPGLDVDQVFTVDLPPLPAGEHELLVRVVAGGTPSALLAAPFVVSSAPVPVVLVPGWNAGSPSPDLAGLSSWRSRLESLGRPVFLAQDQDAWGTPQENADGLAATVGEALPTTLAPVVDVVSHGAGAFAVRDWLDRGGDAVARRVVLVAGPHHGSGLADDLHAALLAAAEAGDAAAAERLADDLALPVMTTPGASAFEATHRDPDDVEDVAFVLLAAERLRGPAAGTDDVVELASAIGLPGSDVTVATWRPSGVAPPLHRRMLTSAAFFDGFLAPALSGQLAAGLSSTALSSGSRVPLVAPGSRASLSVALTPQPGSKFTGTVTVDDGDSVDLEAFSTSSSVSLVAMDPTGKVFSQASARTDPQASADSFGGEGTFSGSSISVSDPEPGAWSLEVSSPGATAPFGKFAQSGAIQPSASTDAPLHAPGDDVAVALDLGTTDAVVGGGQAMLLGPDGSEVVLGLADDGTGPDALAGDGVLTGSAALPGAAAAGKWSVDATATGTIEGTPFERGASTLLEVSSGTVAPTGGFASLLTDPDPQGKLATLEIDTTLSVAEPGTYSVGARLAGPAGKLVAETSQAVELPAGESALTLAFPTTALSRAGASGKFTLDELTVTRASGVQQVAFQGFGLHETDDVDLAALQQDSRPRFRFTAPAAPASTAGEFTLRWEDSDPDDDASISLFLDEDGAGFDGEPIPGAQELSEDDETDSFMLDLSTAAEGTLHVHARITDGETVRQVYAPGEIRVGLDTDGDGVTDAVEIALGLDPGRDDLAADPDVDGLSSGEEVELGTLPLVADTDGGGEGDGREVQYGRDPTVAADDVVTTGRIPGDVAPAGAPDGAVNIADVVRLLRFSVFVEVPSDLELVLGDLAPATPIDEAAEPPRLLRRGDEVVTIADVVLALRMSVLLAAVEEPPPG